MKFPSTRTRLRCIRSKAALGFSGVLLAALLLMTASQAWGAFRAPGMVAVDDDDVIALLGLGLGGRDVAVVAWSNMNLSEKQILRDQAVRIAIMAQGAELDGILESPDVMRALRWGVSSFLADAWEKKIASETDLSESAASSFYEAHRQWYVDSEDRRLPFEKCSTRVREDMIRAAIMERLEKLNAE